MTIHDFITKAIKGGWNIRKGIGLPDGMNISPSLESAAAGPLLHRILLDPLAWQAVGKVEGWCTGEEAASGHCEICRRVYCDTSWLHYMHRMIDALAEGKTIEQYLESLISTSMN